MAATKERKRAWRRRTGLQATEQGVGWSCSGREALSAAVGGARGSGLAGRFRGHPVAPVCWMAGVGNADLPSPSPSCQTLCFRVRKMIDVYKPDWCEVREDWSVYLFSPENRWAGQGLE